MRRSGGSRSPAGAAVRWPPRCCTAVRLLSRCRRTPSSAGTSVDDIINSRPNTRQRRELGAKSRFDHVNPDCSRNLSHWASRTGNDTPVTRLGRQTEAPPVASGSIEAGESVGLRYLQRSPSIANYRAERCCSTECYIHQPVVRRAEQIPPSWWPRSRRTQGHAARAGIKRYATASRPGRPFGTPKSADAAEDPSILAQSPDTRIYPVNRSLGAHFISGSGCRSGIPTGWNSHTAVSAERTLWRGSKRRRSSWFGTWPLAQDWV